MLDILNNNNRYCLLSTLCTSHCAQHVCGCEFPLLTKKQATPPFYRQGN